MYTYNWSLRWWKNRTGRPLSPTQIHQKIIWMLSNFHKTTSEHWRRTPGTQKGSPFSSKGGESERHSIMSDSLQPRPEFWSGKPFPSPGDLPNPGIKPRSPTWQADSLPAEPQGKPHQKEVGQNIKDKKRDKRGRDGDQSWGGSHEGEVSAQ